MKTSLGLGSKMRGNAQRHFAPENARPNEARMKGTILSTRLIIAQSVLRPCLKSVILTTLLLATFLPVGLPL